MSEDNGAVKELTELPAGLRKRGRSKLVYDKEAQAIVPVAEPDPRDARIEKLDKIVMLMRKELQQYRNDLGFWAKAHGNEYPVRRIVELDKAVEEINAV